MKSRWSVDRFPTTGSDAILATGRIPLRWRSVMRFSVRAACSAVLLVAALLVSGTGPASAATGDLLKTVNVPSGAQCPSGISTSVALVPGSLVGRLQNRELLVTSCFTDADGAAEASRLYFLDPTTDPATLVTTVTTTTTPPRGWGSLALRGDKG